jgi:hypothetical protein
LPRFERADAVGADLGLIRNVLYGEVAGLARDAELFGDG